MGLVVIQTYTFYMLIWNKPKGIKPVLQSDVTTTAQFTVLG